MRIKLSSLVSDLFGVSTRRMLEAIAEGETNSQVLAEMAGPNLRASQEQFRDAMQAVSTVHPQYRRVLKQFLKQLELNDRQIRELDEQLARALQPHTLKRSNDWQEYPGWVWIPHNRSFRRGPPGREVPLGSRFVLVGGQVPWRECIG